MKPLNMLKICHRWQCEMISLTFLVLIASTIEVSISVDIMQSLIIGMLLTNMGFAEIE